MKGDEQAAVILDGRVDGGRYPIRINLVAVGFVITLISWVIDENSVRSWGSSDNNAIHGVGLRLRS